MNHTIDARLMKMLH